MSVQTAADTAPLTWGYVAGAVLLVLCLAVLAAPVVASWLRARRALQNLPLSEQPSHCRRIDRNERGA